MAPATTTHVDGGIRELAQNRSGCEKRVIKKNFQRQEGKGSYDRKTENTGEEVERVTPPKKMDTKGPSHEEEPSKGRRWKKAIKR